MVVPVLAWILYEILEAVGATDKSSQHSFDMEISRMTAVLYNGDEFKEIRFATNKSKWLQ